MRHIAVKRSRLSLLLPTAALLLSGCQQVLASDDSNGERLTIRQEVTDYQQVISLKQSTRSQNTSVIPTSHTITEATLFPQVGEGYGTRIIKKAQATPTKWNIYASKKGAFQQKNNGEWVSSATTDPLFATLEVYSYDTFAELAKLFLEEGQVTETRDEYLIAYTGSDNGLNQNIAALLNQFPTEGTSFDAAITVDKKDRHVTSFHLAIQKEQPGQEDISQQEIEAAFHKFNSNALPEKPEK